MITHTQCMQKHNPIQDLVKATQRKLQYTAEANALSNDVQYIVSKPLQTLSSNSLASKRYLDVAILSKCSTRSATDTDHNNV